MQQQTHVHVPSSEAQNLRKLVVAKRVWEGFAKTVRLRKFVSLQYLSITYIPCQ